MKKYTLYIGSNNNTGILELNKALEVIAKVFEGFSFQSIKGFWKGKQEDTLKVELVAENADDKVISLCEDLKKELAQDSIMLEVAKHNVTFQ